MDDYTSIRNAWNTCLELVSDRGYTIDENYSKLSDNDINHMISNNKLDIISKDNQNSIYIKFLVTQRIKPSLIKEVIEEIIEEIKNSVLDIVLVLKTKPNNSILKLVKEYTNVQIMWVKQLQFNPTKHYIVPKHTKLDEKEVNKIIQDYNLSSKFQLPLLLKDDVISRYYNFKSGDVIKMTNAINTQNPNYIFYRCVR
tara:strand:- start:305 stop:898 length:594 start_codon:yes stop_codon:yes gene_type:complete